MSVKYWGVCAGAGLSENWHSRTAHGVWVRTGYARAAPWFATTMTPAVITDAHATAIARSLDLIRHLLSRSAPRPAGALPPGGIATQARWRSGWRLSSVRRYVGLRSE